MNVDRPKIRKFRDIAFCCFAFPLAVAVFVSFGTLYTIDRECVYPMAYEPYIPSWMLHMMNTIIAAFVIMELIFLHHRYPKKKYGVAGIALLMDAYVGWVVLNQQSTGFWPYPILSLLSFTQKLVFATLCRLLPILMYFAGDIASGLIWNSNRFGGMKIISDVTV